jgi:hypothetical protein
LTLALPAVPDLISPTRRLDVSFQDRHLVAIPAQQQGGTEADDPGTDDHDPGDGDPRPLPDAIRETYAEPKLPGQLAVEKRRARLSRPAATHQGRG